MSDTFIDTATLKKARIAVFIGALLLSLSALIYFYQANLNNIYGDGVAHLNIARFMVDIENATLWQRYKFLGSPWLPLPHVLLLPFAYNDQLWRTGLAGSIVSMGCYLTITMVLFEIGTTIHRSFAINETSKNRILAGVLAASIFAFNPSILYLQTTPMTELPFLVAVTISAWLLMRWSLSFKTRSLIFAAIAASMATLTRYEAWAAIPVGIIIVFLVAPQGKKIKMAFIYGLIATIAPIYWLWHNWVTYGNPLEFYNGYYSAKQIYLRQPERLGWASFAIGNPIWSLVLACVASLACVGSVALIFFIGSLINFIWQTLTHSINRIRTQNYSFPQALTLTLLLVPFLFIVYSLFTGNIQIYAFSAISLLNVRYGVTVILAIAAFPALWISGDNGAKRFLVLFLMILIGYGWFISEGVTSLAVIQEPMRNNIYSRDARARNKLENYLRAHAMPRKVLVCYGELPQSAPKAGLTFSNMEFFYGQFKDGNLPQYINCVIAREGDDLWQLLSNNEQFNKEFYPVYTVGPQPQFMVWRRR